MIVIYDYHDELILYQEWAGMEMWKRVRSACIDDLVAVSGKLRSSVELHIDNCIATTLLWR